MSGTAASTVQSTTTTCRNCERDVDSLIFIARDKVNTLIILHCRLDQIIATWNTLLLWVSQNQYPVCDVDVHTGILELVAKKERDKSA